MPRSVQLKHSSAADILAGRVAGTGLWPVPAVAGARYPVIQVRAYIVRTFHIKLTFLDPPVVIEHPITIFRQISVRLLSSSICCLFRQRPAYALGGYKAYNPRY